MPTYQILYARRPTFHASGTFGTPLVTAVVLRSTHVRLCDVEADSLDDAWCQMQGENWSPNGEARPLLKRLDLSHTSMSVGDVIQDEDGIYWECVDIGWRRVEDEIQGDDYHDQA
jgi:hypothetical protein